MRRTLAELCSAGAGGGCPHVSIGEGQTSASVHRVVRYTALKIEMFGDEVQSWQ